MRKKQHLIYLLIGPILSIIAFLVAYFVDPLNYNVYSSLAAIPAFLFSVIVLIISHIIVIYKEVEKVSDNSDSVREDVKNCLHATKIGTPKKAWEYIMHRLPIIEYVQNTSFNFEDEDEQSNERLYHAALYKQSLIKISRQIELGLTWKDVGDSTALERFQAISGQIKESKNSGRYEFKLIGRNEPQINFILITYKDGAKEVLFNWDFRAIPHDPTVLLSRDAEIFNMFAAQHKCLWRSAVHSYDSIATKSTS